MVIFKIALALALCGPLLGIRYGIMAEERDKQTLGNLAEEIRRN